MGSCSAHPKVATITWNQRICDDDDDLNGDYKRSVSRFVCKRVTRLLNKPLKASLIVSYHKLYDELIHKRILRFPMTWAEVHGSYGENTCVYSSDVDFMRIVDNAYVSPADLDETYTYKPAFIVVDDQTRMSPGSCWLRLFHTNVKDDEFDLHAGRNGLEWFLNCQDSNIRGYARPYCRASTFDEHTHYPYNSESDKIVCILPLLKTDKFGRIFLNRAKFQEYIAKQGLTFMRWFNRLLPQWTNHGPANSQKYFGLFDVDVVDAFHCPSGWPTSANEWLTRQRVWPDDNFVKDISISGFHVIPIGSKMLDGEDLDLEWRISFRTAETKLVRAFSKYQRLVFITLKIIVKEFIQPKFVDEDFMSSYIVKTLVLWVSGETNQEDWTENNFMNCLSKCLEMLKEWLHVGFCPHYFIPGYNLFRTKLHRMFLLGFREWLISEIDMRGWKIIFQCPSLKLKNK